MQAAIVRNDLLQFKMHTLIEIPQSESNVASFPALATFQFLTPWSQSISGWLEGLGATLKVRSTLSLMYANIPLKQKRIHNL